MQQPLHYHRDQPLKSAKFEPLRDAVVLCNVVKKQQPIERVEEKKKKGWKRKIEEISKFRQNQFVMHNEMVVGWRRYATREIRYFRPRGSPRDRDAIKRKKRKCEYEMRRNGKGRNEVKNSRDEDRSRVYTSHVCDIIARKRVSIPYSSFSSFSSLRPLPMNGRVRPVLSRGIKRLFDNERSQFQLKSNGRDELERVQGETFALLFFSLFFFFFF